MSIWITGSGAVSCLGLGKDQLFASVLRNDSGIDAQGLGSVSEGNKHILVDSLGGVRGVDKMSWPLQISLWAARESMQSAGWTELTENDGLILATTTGQIPLWDSALERYYQKQIPADEFKTIFKHYPLGTIVDDFCGAIHPLLGKDKKFVGPRTLVASACGASTQALAMAALWIESGKVERCLVGGMEVLCDLTIEGFRSLKLLSTSRAQPFDQNRTGINLSEASAFFCLEKNKNAASVQLSGFGLSTDSYHMTSPHPEGQGSYVSMQKALAKARLSAKDIGWVHAHGTGSLHNDLAEGIAIERVFENTDAYISSTKWYHGHALGVSGILESVLSLEGLKNNVQVATGGLNTIDEKIHLKIPKEHGRKSIKAVLKNTLGFGGVNASVIMEKHI